MTEHSAVVFVFFFLAEYSSLVLMCILISIFFFGGYLMVDLLPLIYFLIDILYKIAWYLWSVEDVMFLISAQEVSNPNQIYYFLHRELHITLSGGFNVLTAFFITLIDLLETLPLIPDMIKDTPGLEGVVRAFIIGLKSCILIFIFVWCRASFPRVRFDQLMSFCWTVLLPLLFAFIIFIPCILYSFDILPQSAILL